MSLADYTQLQDVLQEDVAITAASPSKGGGWALMLPQADHEREGKLPAALGLATGAQ